jgi:hypothetical protein
MYQQISDCLDPIPGKGNCYKCRNKGHVYLNVVIFPLHCACKRPQKQLSDAERLTNKKLIEETQKLANEAYERLGILKKSSHYTKALAKWGLAGFPINIPDEIVRRAEICAMCDRYAANSGCCSICGCPSNANGLPVKNKAAMATESCPHPADDKWQ